MLSTDLQLTFPVHCNSYCYSYIDMAVVRSEVRNLSSLLTKCINFGSVKVCPALPMHTELVTICGLISWHIVASCSLIIGYYVLWI